MWCPLNEIFSLFLVWVYRICTALYKTLNTTWRQRHVKRVNYYAAVFLPAIRYVVRVLNRTSDQCYQLFCELSSVSSDRYMWSCSKHSLQSVATAYYKKLKLNQTIFCMDSQFAAAPPNANKPSGSTVRGEHVGFFCVLVSRLLPEPVQLQQNNQLCDRSADWSVTSHPLIAPSNCESAFHNLTQMSGTRWFVSVEAQRQKKPMWHLKRHIVLLKTRHIDLKKVI